MRKNILNSLRNISENLGKIPSMGYAFTYLICIPVFALFYWIAPYQFYHSTVKYESVLNYDADRILRDIRKEIISEFHKSHGSYTAIDGSWSLNITSINVYSLKPVSDSTKFTIKLELWGVDSMKSVQAVMSINVYIENKESFSSFSPGDKWHTVFKRPDIENGKKLLFSPKLIFPHELNKSSMPANSTNETIWFPISRPLNNKIIGFAHAVKGFPSKASGSYARMFYFSAVTITTLGYGDIVPITNITRILVAIESILGLILIGLFLNSLSWEKQFRQENN